jgi:hypothetical protein
LIMGIQARVKRSKGAGGQLEDITAAQEKRTKAREKEARGLYDRIIKMFEPGGQYGQGTEAMLDRQKKRDVGASMQQLISSGLYGTTTAAGLPIAWEEAVGAPTRAKLEDMRYGQLATSLGNKAQFVTNIEDVLPDYGMIAGLQSQASARPLGSMGGGGSSFPITESLLPARGALTGGTQGGKVDWTARNLRADQEIAKRKTSASKSKTKYGDTIYGSTPLPRSYMERGTLRA